MSASRSATDPPTRASPAASLVNGTTRAVMGRRLRAIRGVGEVIGGLPFGNRNLVMRRTVWVRARPSMMGRLRALALGAPPSIPYVNGIRRLVLSMSQFTRSMVMTVDEFLAHDFPEGKVELVRGEPRVTPPAGGPHATVATNLLRRNPLVQSDHAAAR